MLVTVAEHAYPVHKNETLKEAALLLKTLPFSDSYKDIGFYYLGLHATRRQDYGEARASFNRVIESKDTLLKARALVSLGGVYRREGDLGTAATTYFEAVRAATSNDCRSPLPLMMAGMNLAMVDSLLSNHRRSLENLENLLPIVEMIGPAHPQEYYSYFNGLAVELGEAGRFEEARNVIKLVLRSPIAFTYPEWLVTRDEIIEKEGRASRSKAVIWRGNAAPNNILHLPVHAQEAGSELVESPRGFPAGGRARILRFRSQKKRTGIGMTGSKDSNSDEPAKQLSRKQKVIRIVDLVTNNLTEEQLDQILDAIVEIAPEK